VREAPYDATPKLDGGSIGGHLPNCRRGPDPRDRRAGISLVVRIRDKNIFALPFVTAWTLASITGRPKAWLDEENMAN
jgi:hypothetical protein